MHPSRWRRRFRSCCSRIAQWPRRRARDAALAEEIAAHLELEAQALEAEGLSPGEARAAARRAFGNSALALEDSRAAWRWRWVDDLARDLRLAWRALAHNRGFAAAAVVTLALGIAALATMFSLVDAWELRPLPVAQPQRVAILSEYYARNGGYFFCAVSPLDYLALRRRIPALSAQTAAAGISPADLGPGDGLTPVQVQAVAPNFFSVLGVSAQLGRTFFRPAARSTVRSATQAITAQTAAALHAAAAATGPSAAALPSAALATGAPATATPVRRHVAVISASLWRGRFAARRSVLGRQILLNHQPYTVIGVMPRGFFVPRAYAQIWIPLAFGPAQLASSARGDRSLTVYARLRSGATFRQARAQLAMVMAGLSRRYRADHEWRVAVHPLNAFITDEGNNAPVYTLLMAAAGLLMLLACANVAGLLLARAAARRHELALRTALGAGRFRLLRQLLAESALLAAAAAVLGLAISWWTVRLFASEMNTLAHGNRPALQLDWRVAVFALAAAAVTAILFGLVPAWQASHADPQPALQSDARGSVGGRARLRRCLVAAEVALTIVLLATAAMFLTSVEGQLSPAGFGFNPRRLTVASVRLRRPGPGAAPSAPGDSSAWAAAANAIAARLRHLPGVTAAATADALPLNGSGATSVTLAPGGASHGAALYPVSPGYFATLQIPLLRGRDFTAADTAAAPAVAIVDRGFVRQYLRGRNAVGRTVVVGYFDYLNTRGRLVNASVHPRPVTIVGVVGPVQRFLGDTSHEPAMYFPLAQWPTAHSYAIVRSTGPRPTAAEMDHAIRAAAGPRGVVGGVSSMNKIIAESAAGDWLIAGLVAVFAVLALVLAAVGIYGVMAYAARRRTAEIGVRLALGARRRAIAAMILREAAIFTGVGWLIGLGLAALLPRMLAAVFGAGHFPTYAQSVWPAAVLIPLAALAAAYLPARRAARLDPAHCLRHE